MKFNPDQIEALLEIPELNDHVKTHLREINDKIGEGDVLEIDYYAATRKARRINRQTGKPYYISKYSSRIRMSRRKVVPYHMNISKAGNFHVKALDLTQLGNKIDKWGKDKNKKNWIKEWKNTDELYTDLSRYLTNLTKPEGERVPSSSLFGETKRNILNELLGSRRKELVNPLQLLEYAEKDNLIRDFRLDRINQMRWETFMGKEWKMSEDNYQLQKMNYLPANLQPENLEVNTPRINKEQEANIKEVQDHYDKVTPQRVKELKREALESLSVRIEELGIPKKEAKQLAQKTYNTILKNTKRTSSVVSGIGEMDLTRMAGTSTKKGGFAMRPHINKSWLTSAFEAIEKDSDVAAMKAQQVAKQLSKKELGDMMEGVDAEAQKASGNRAATMKLGEEFRDRESLADEKAFGSSLRKDVNAPPRVYASVGEGQKFLSAGNYDAFFVWKKSAPIVATSHHHYGVGNGMTNIHAAQNVGVKNEFSFGDPTNEKYTKLKSGKQVLDTHLLVGNKGINEARAHQLMVSIPAGDLSNVKKAYKKNGASGAWKELEISAFKQSIGKGSQGRSKGFKYTAKDGTEIPLRVAVQRNRTEAYVLDPRFENVESVTIVAQRQEDTAALKKKIETAFKANGVKLPKVNIVYPESGPSPHRGRQKLVKEFEQLTGEVNYLPEVDGKPLGPSSEQMLQSLLDGNISRDQFDAAIEVLRPVDKVEVPTEEKIQLNQDNMRKLYIVMKPDDPSKGDGKKFPLVGEAEKLPEGTPVGLRIDIPSFNKSVELMKKGVLSEPVYAVTIHEGADNKSKLGTRIGYDIFSRVKRFSKDKPVRFHTINQTRSEQIGTGEKPKTTLATAEGLLVKSRELPKDLNSWAQVGMNPKRHTYFYDRETGQAVKGGDEAINFGNTVFVKNPIYYSNAERLSLFTYMPEALGKSEITKTDDGYKAIKRDGKTRVYSPRGKLIGVASSEKVADSIYRRHNARTVSVR
jgi:hypothetical protein